MIPGAAMSPLFSAIFPHFGDDRHPQHIDLQLLPDDALLDIWEQAQRTVWMLNERGWDSARAIHYCEILLWEMQRRQVRRPLGSYFGDVGRISISAVDIPKIVTIQI